MKLPRANAAKPETPPPTASAPPDFVYESGDLQLLPTPHFLVGDTSFQRGTVTLVCGAKGVGKLQFGIALCLSVVSEVLWGTDKFEPEQVFYVCLEKFRSLKQREPAWCSINGVATAHVNGAYWWDGGKARWTLPGGIDKLSDMIDERVAKRSVPFGVIVIDHLRRALLGKSALGPIVADAIMRRLEDLAQKHNVAIVLVCHTDKQSEHVAGPAEFSNYATEIYQVTAEGDTVTVGGRKNNDRPEMNFIFSRKSVDIPGDKGRIMPTAALVFVGKEPAVPARSAVDDTLYNIAVTMKWGEVLSAKQLTTKMWGPKATGKNRNDRLKAALPNLGEWKIVTVTGRRAAVQRVLLPGGTFPVFRCAGPASLPP